MRLWWIVGAGLLVGGCILSDKPDIPGATGGGISGDGLTGGMQDPTIGLGDGDASQEPPGVGGASPECETMPGGMGGQLGPNEEECPR